MNIISVVCHYYRIAFPFDEEIKLTSGLSTGEVTGFPSCVVDASSIGQELVQTEQPFAHSVLCWYVRKVSPPAVSMSGLDIIVYFLGSLSPVLALEILREESSNPLVCAVFYFLENPCFH